MESLRLPFKELREKETELVDDLTTTRAALQTLIKLCKHDYKYEGNDSHKTYEKCTICGDTISI